MKKIYIPGSKSVSNRALVLAAISPRRVLLQNLLVSDDIQYLRESLGNLGVVFEDRSDGLLVTPPAKLIAPEGTRNYIGAGGTPARFISGVSLITYGSFTVHGIDRIHERPFVDLFAGAGGFSEGFLQAESNNKFFDFVVANDINENCELTHIVRYNHQLGLDAKFLKQDITEPDFLDNLLEKIDGKKIDVVCGGPPCQSFSLAGKRKKFDKKDDLFAHYLKVIKVLQPKYFVMENVKGILVRVKSKH